MQKKMRTLYYRILSISIVPIIILGAVLIFCSCSKIKETLENEIKNELRSTTYALQEMYNLMDEGDYSEDINGNVYKGDYLIQGRLSRIDSQMNKSGIYITFFYGNRRVDTSLTDENGERIVGSTMDVDIYHQVFEESNEVFVRSLVLADKEYYGYYIPIFNSDGSIVGSLLAGKLTRDIDNKINAAITVMVSICALVIIITIGLAALGVAYLIRYMKKMIRDEESIEEVRRADRAKTEFLTLMSHEIRTPINAVLGMNDMVLREHPTDKIKEYSLNIKEAGNSLLSLVNSILDFSKVEAGEMEVDNSEFSLSALINDCYNLVVNDANQKKLKFLVEYDETTPNRLFGDVFKIKQIVANYLTNAVKFTSEGSITLHAGHERIDRDHINLIISVKDTGNGISEKDRDAIFTSIGKIGDSKHSSVNGGGIGLVLCKKLADLMGGKVSVESKLGFGSKFTVSIPVIVTAPGSIKDVANEFKSISEREYAEEKVFEAPGLKILVVDDTPINLKVVQGLLSKSLIDIDVADGGVAAIELAIANKYDLIFMDHMMPEMDGHETLIKIREYPNCINVDTPVIVLTANAIVGAKEEYLEMGFTDYLSKPVKKVDLEEMIKKHMK